ncbi:superoxide dismutase family protein [Croceiramulus getboli]|nr:superoxide dismutase family protein [Flavobacteriaceae bacterium YJPT1-3]
MKIKAIVLSVLAVAALSLNACKGKEKSETETSTETEMNKEEEMTVKKVTFKLSPKSDSQAKGSVVFKEENGQVTMTAVMDGLSEGTHAIHIHEEADCSAADATSTGGHWNPTFEDHGKWGDAGGFHRGDIGNFEADANGNGTITMTTDLWCIGCDDEKKNILGKAIIVHQGADDFTSQPSGAAGARVSCGGIIK